VTRVAAGIVCTCLLLAAGGCHGRPARQPSPSPTSAGAATVTLTADHPTAYVSQPSRPDATTVRLDIRAIDNPSGQGLAIGVAVEATGTPARRANIGTVSPYPGNQPGVFTLPLPASATQLVRHGTTVLVVTVTAAVPGTPLRPDVRLSLTAGAAGP
jgi:hypothetical protein